HLVTEAVACNVFTILCILNKIASRWLKTLLPKLFQFKCSSTITFKVLLSYHNQTNLKVGCCYFVYHTMFVCNQQFLFYFPEATSLNKSSAQMQCSIFDNTLLFGRSTS